VRVRAPATSANLGPGFDAFGLALTLHDEINARVTNSGLDIQVSGEGAGDVPQDERHLVVRAMRATFDLLGGQPPGIALQCANRIPHARGLGSSAAAIVAGIVTARELAKQRDKADRGELPDERARQLGDGERPPDGGERLADESKRPADGRARPPDGGERLHGGELLPDEEVLALAAELEGHPDNVAACLYGGFTIAWVDGGLPRAVRHDVAANIAVRVFVPPNPVSTEYARTLLPERIRHADAAHAAGRAALLVTALAGRPDLLLPATVDRLHQHYRAPAMPDSVAFVERLRAAGIAAVISGAGPAVIAFSIGEPDRLGKIVTDSAWQMYEVAVDNAGVSRVRLI
jgi:homoserine kinase